MPAHEVEIIAAGWSRTGTSSLKAALEILGYPTYHMVENVQNGQAKFWIRVSNGENVDFNECFCLRNKKYTATSDLPAAVYWREQLRQYPNAKVILTVREVDSWYKSCANTVFMSVIDWPGVDIGIRVGLWLGMPTPGFAEMITKVVTQRSFHGDLSERNIKQCYLRHNKEVMTECPPEKLLVFDPSQGWEPLCRFLDKPIPPTPFPRLNTTEDFQVLVHILRGAGYLALACSIGLPVLASYLYWKYRS